MTWDAFISYSQRGDAVVAPALREALHRYAKPWHKRRAVRIFLDNSSMSVDTKLWSALTDALDGSSHLIVLLRPESAGSRWVDAEIAYWLEHKSLDTLLPVLTGGELVWDETNHRYDTDRSTAVPPSLVDAFTEEPRHLDLRWAVDEDDLHLADGRFLSAVAELAAPLHGVSKDELEGEDVRQHRRTRRIVRFVVATLSILLVVASISALLAVANARRAESRRVDALALGLEIESRAGTDSTELSVVLAAEAHRLRATPETEAALRQAAGAAPEVQWVSRDHVGAIDGLAILDGSTYSLGADGRVVRHGRAGEPIDEIDSIAGGLDLVALQDSLALVTSLGVTLFDANTLEMRGPGTRFDAAPAGWAADADNTGVVVALQNGSVVDADGRVLFSPHDANTALAVAPDGAFITAGIASTTQSFELVMTGVAGDERWRRAFDGFVRSMTIGHDMLLVGDGSGQVTAISLVDGTSLSTYSVATGPVGQIVVAAGERALVVGPDASIWSLDLATGQVAAQGFGHAGGATRVALDGSAVITGGADGRVALHEPERGRIGTGVRVPLEVVAGAVVLDGEGVAIVGLADGRLARIDGDDVQTFASADAPIFALASLGGSRVAVGTEDGRLLVADHQAAPGGELIEVGVDSRLLPILRLVASPDGSRAVTLTERGAEVWLLQPDAAMEQIVGFGLAAPPTFDPTSTRVASDSGEHISVVDVNDRSTTQIPIDMTVRAFAFDASGDVVVAGSGTEIRFYSVSQASEIDGLPLSYASPVTDLRFVDENLLLSVHDDGIMRFWDPVSRSSRGESAMGVDGTLRGLDLSSAPGRVVLTDDAPSLIDLSLEIDDIRIAACDLFGRSFTADERRRYDLDADAGSRCE